LAFSQSVNVFNADDVLLVFDFGGGTFDVSLLKRSAGQFTVLAIDGDSHLGGADIDDLVVKEILRAGFGSKPPKLTERQSAQLRDCAERAKIQLSFQQSVSTSTDSFFPGQNVDVTLSRARFNHLIAPIIAKMHEVVERLLKVSQQTPTVVLLVGGTSRIPAIRSHLEEKFHFKLSSAVHPDEAVGIGAGLLAEKLANGRESEVPPTIWESIISTVSRTLNTDLVTLTSTERQRRVSLQEVTAHSLGTGILGDRFSILIPRYSKYPGSWQGDYTTTVDYQKTVSLPVYEGEDPTASKNKLLSSFELTGIQHALKNVPQLKVSYSLDENGVLSVTALDQATKAKNGVQVDALEWSAMSDESLQIYRAKLQKSSSAHSDL